MINNPLARIKVTAAAVLLTLVTLTPTAAAGSETGALLGKTVDFDGKAVKKVAIVLTSPDDPNFEVETKSDKNGVFEIIVDNAELTHEIRFDGRGFVIMKSAVDIEPGQQTERVFTMLTQQEVDEGKGEIVRQRELAANADPAVDLYNEGVVAFQAGDLAGARISFEQALEHNSTMAPALAALAVIALEQEDWAAAADAAARTLEIDPTDTRAMYAAYRANTALGHSELAATAAAGLAANGGNVDAAARIFNEGADAYRAHDYEKAKSFFSEAVALDPTLVDGYGALASIAASEGDFDDAEANAVMMLDLEPGNAKALKIRFEVALAEGNDRLQATMADLAAIDAQYVSNAVNERAFGLFEKNRYDDSRQLVDLMLALDPDNARANYTLGLILVNAGDTSAAREHLQRSIDLAPEDPDAAGARALLEQLQ